MSHHENDEDVFCLFAMQLFFKAGHVATSEPVFTNHSPEQFVYFDNRTDASLSREQRAMFKAFSNVSYLFTANDCKFYSLNLLTTKSIRSQTAHDIHTMIHPLIGSSGSVCLFRNDDEIMLSFIGYGKRCILSDWYPLEDDYERLLCRLDIGNISVENNYDYFFDLIYILGRNYYLCSQPSTYELFPIDFITSAGIDGVDREEINNLVEQELRAPEREYGDDYVEYDESPIVRGDNIIKELDLMILEMDDESDNPFGEDVENEDDIDAEDRLNEDSGNEERDEYEFDDVDPEIFRDPTKLVKWLNKNSS